MLTFFLSLFEITLIDEQAGELQQQNPDSIRRSERIIRFNEFKDERGDDILRVFGIRSRRTSDQLLPVAVFKAQREAGDDDELKINFTLRTCSELKLV